MQPNKPYEEILRQRLKERRKAYYRISDENTDAIRLGAHFAEESLLTDRFRTSTTALRAALRAALRLASTSREWLEINYGFTMRTSEIVSMPQDEFEKFLSSRNVPKGLIRLGSNYGFR